MTNDMERSSSSTFNMGVATLERIDSLLRDISTLWKRGGLYTLKIRDYQRELYKELHPFLNTLEREEGDRMGGGNIYL